MYEPIQVLEKSVSELVQRKISVSLGIPLPKVSKFFSKLNLPEKGVFIFDAIKRVASLRCHFIERMSDDLNAEFIETVELAEKIIQSSVFSQITESFFQVSLEEWVKRHSFSLNEKELHDLFFSEVFGNCVKNPLFMICLYPVYLGDFGKDHEDALNEYLMILGAILNQHFINVENSQKAYLEDDEYKNLLYGLSLDCRRFDICQDDKLNLDHCRSISDMLEQMSSLPYSSENREKISLFTSFIKKPYKPKKHRQEKSKNISRFNPKDLLRGVFKVHSDFFIYEMDIDIGDKGSILFLEKTTEEAGSEQRNHELFVIPIEGPRESKLYSEKELNGYHRKYQNLVLSQIPVSDNRSLLAKLWIISRHSKTISASDLKAVIYILLAMLTGSNPKNIATPKHLNENADPIIERINFKAISPFEVKIFIPLLVAKTNFVDGLDCYESHLPFFTATLPKIFSNIIFNVLSKYENKTSGGSLTFNHHVSKSITKILQSISGAGLTLALVIQNTVHSFHKLSNGSTYVAYCLSSNSNSLAATQKHYASVSESALTKVFYKVIQNQFGIKFQISVPEEAIYLGNASLLKTELLKEKIAYYYENCFQQELSVLNRFNSSQTLLGLLGFTVSAGRNVRHNKSFHKLCLDQRLSQVFEKNRKQKSIKVFFWDDKRTKNASNIRLLVAPRVLDEIMDLEQKLVEKLKKENIVIDLNEDQFFKINEDFHVSYFLQADLAKFDFDVEVRPNVLRAWVFSTLLNQIITGNLKISGESLDALMGHGHAGSEFWNPYSLKDPQISLKELFLCVESLECILNIGGDHK